MPDTTPLIHEHERRPKSRFADIDLSETLFRDVRLCAAVFDNADLTGATFRNVRLADVAVVDADIEGMTIDGVPVTELLRAWRASRPAA